MKVGGGERGGGPGGWPSRGLASVAGGGGEMADMHQLNCLDGLGE